MDRFLARLERRFGRFAIPNLIAYPVGAAAVVWVLTMVRPEVFGRLEFDPYAIRAGQVWRLVTFLLLPTDASPLLLLFKLYVTWWIGSSLEEYWGTFKFNAYYLTGVVGAVGAAFVAGPQSSLWLNSSLFLAFATAMPDVQIRLYFILPIRAKWLGLVSALGLGYAFLTGGPSVRFAIAAAFGNYLLFFAGHWVDVLRQRNVIVRQRAKREVFKDSESVFGRRVCAICGAREAEGADIRVCSCEKCGGVTRTLCVKHAREH